MEKLLKNWPEGGDQAIFYKTNSSAPVIAYFIILEGSQLLITLRIQLYRVQLLNSSILGPSPGVYLNQRTLLVPKT